MTMIATSLDSQPEMTDQDDGNHKADSGIHFEVKALGVDKDDCMSLTFEQTGHVAVVPTIMTTTILHKDFMEPSPALPPALAQRQGQGQGLEKALSVPTR